MTDFALSDPIVLATLAVFAERGPALSPSNLSAAWMLVRELRADRARAPPR